MKKVLTGSQKSFLNNKQPKTPLGNNNNAMITSDGNNIMLKGLPTVSTSASPFKSVVVKDNRTNKLQVMESTALATKAYRIEFVGGMIIAQTDIVTIPGIAEGNFVFNFIEQGNITRNGDITIEVTGANQITVANISGEIIGDSYLTVVVYPFPTSIQVVND